MNRHAEQRCGAVQGEHSNILCPEPIYAEAIYHSALGEVPVYLCELHLRQFDPPSFRLLTP